MKLKLLVWVSIAAHFCASAHESPEKWDSLMSEGSELKKSGNFSQAALSLREALAIADGFESQDRRILGTLDELASVEADAGQFAEAARHYRRALLLAERTYGQNSIEYALLLGSLASLSSADVNTSEAVATVRKALDAQAGSEQQSHSLRAYLFQIYQNQKQYPEAEAVLLEDQTEFQRQHVTDSLQKATLSNSLGMIRFNQKRFQQATALYRECVKIRETAVGVESPQLIEPLNNAAASLFQEKQYEASYQCYHRAISLCEKTLGASHPTCATTLANYAVVLQKFGRKHEAKVTAQAAEEARKSSVRQNGFNSIVDVKALREE